MMGYVYGRTHYWVWRDDCVSRVILTGAVRMQKLVACIGFYFKDDPRETLYFLPPSAFATSRQIALDNHEYMDKFITCDT